MRWWQLKKRDADLERELCSDLELEEEEQRENGLPPEEARFAARRAFGNATLIREQTREVWGWLWLEWLLKDVRYAIRGLFRSPIFTLVSVLSLALGVGVVTAMFGVFEAVFLDAVSAEHVAQLRHIEPGDSDVSYRYYQYLASANDQAVVGLIAYSENSLSFRSGNDLESIAGDIVSPNFFDLLGVKPAIGRGFSTDEQQAERETQVAIVSHAFWERKFNATPDILGRVIELNRRSFTIIGVLPKGYRSVHGYGMTPDVYVPISEQLVGNLNDPSAGSLQLIARTKDGVTASQLKDSLAILVQGWRRLYPDDQRYSGQIDTYPLTGIEKLRRDGVPLEVTVFVALMTLVAVLVLLIACANVAGLLVARGVNRTREIAVRLALGAARYRLVQQLLTESALLAAIGTCVGIVFYLGMAATVANFQIRAAIPFELHLRLDKPLLYLSIALVGITTILSGLVPALQSSRGRWQLGSNQIGGERHHRYSLRRALVMGQFALTFVLLVSAALFVRGLAKNYRVDPGFNVQHVLTAEVTLDAASYPPARSEQFFEKAISEIGRVPGVRSVSGAAVIPLGIEHWVMSMKAEGRIVQRVFVNSVTSDYFRTMQIPLLRGRDFQTGDRVDGVQVAIVNDAFARLYLNNNALDKLVYIPEPGAHPRFSSVKIIGVVGDSKYGSLGEETMPALYWPVSQHYRALTLVVSTNSEPAGEVAAIRQSLVSLNPSVPIKIELMRERLAGALLPSKIASLLLGGIGALGLLLATIGIYGVMAYSVECRTAEIGIRLALGATRAHVLRFILRDATSQLCVGIMTGSILAIFVAQALGKALPAGMKVVDPLSFLLVGGILASVGLTAAFVPAWRASRIDPNAALRFE
jgi:predicted permease